MAGWVADALFAVVVAANVAVVVALLADSRLTSCSWPTMLAAAACSAAVDSHR